MKRLKEKIIETTCVKCGKCLSVCPVYEITRREPDSPRGKVALLEAAPDRDLLKSKRLDQILHRCLLCGACAEKCPNAVPAGDLIWRGRVEVADVRGMPLSKRAASKYLLRNKWMLPAFLKSGSLLQGLFFRKVPEQSGLHRRFPLPLIQKGRFIPRLSRDFFVGSRDMEFTAQRPRMKVALFVGCVMNYLFPDMARSLVDVLLKAQVSVVVPANQQCCGLPAYGFGDARGVLELARRNEKALSGLDADYIVCPCSSCSTMLNSIYPSIIPEIDKELGEKIAALAPRIFDFSRFLVEKVNLPQLLEQKGKAPDISGDKKAVVAYHDPCHLKNLQHLTAEPRELLRAVPGIDFLEQDVSECCGMGGSFNLAHYDLSLDILKGRLDSLAKEKVDVISTGCSGCLLQFMDAAHRKMISAKIMHPAEIIASSLKE